MIGKFNVILDLDQTLISGEELRTFNVKKQHKKMEKFDYKIMDKDYIIFARPYLQEFLDFLFANFRVAVWTAASKDYAIFIVNNFILTKPKRKLDFVFYSHHCDMSRKLKKGLKGLSMLWDVFQLKNYNEQNTIIIDDNSEVVKNQEDNVIQIRPFYYKNRASYQDTELKKIKYSMKNSATKI
jgi:hypothetical protein